MIKNRVPILAALGVQIPAPPLTSYATLNTELTLSEAQFLLDGAGNIHLIALSGRGE